jgi:hypothetical protein
MYIAAVQYYQMYSRILAERQSTDRMYSTVYAEFRQQNSQMHAYSSLLAEKEKVQVLFTKCANIYIHQAPGVLVEG